MIIVDRLGKRVNLSNRLAINELSKANSLRYNPIIKFAVVLNINSSSLSIQYDDGYLNDNFTNDQFVIIPSEVINLFSSLEKEIYNKGFINV
jgi:hypothetical protein